MIKSLFRFLLSSFKIGLIIGAVGVVLFSVFLICAMINEGVALAVLFIGCVIFLIVIMKGDFFK